MPQWLPESACADVLRSLLRAALSTYRGCAAPPEWDASVPLDSLERLHLAATVNRFFRLHETGSEDRLLMLRAFDDWVGFVAEAMGSTSGLAFQTSGSTGAPTTQVHPWAHLALEAEALQQRLCEVARIERVVAWLPLHHLYGFMLGVALPGVMGTARVSVESAMPPELRAGDLLVTVPPRWDYLARTRVGWSPGHQASTQQAPTLGASSTAPLAAATHAALLDQGLTGLLEIYGSTETGGVATRWRPDAPYTLLAHWQRQDANRLRHASGALVSLPDHTEWQDARRFTLGARQDDVVSIGGVNVSPAYVAQRLQALDSVADCAVRPTTTAEPRLKAFVVPATSAAEAAAEIARVTADWPAAERPVTLTYGASLPRTALGKLGDWST
ncbi:MAG: AMP-binding protein [Halochromatium sp.]|uniref:AMP-binding protein n=1 Tax=Halochromatium sp. TaxID=2049430 RepID=UPI00397C24A8